MNSIDELLKLRTFIQSHEGGLLKIFISDYITSESGKSIDAQEIKGMCRLFEKIKRIPEELEKLNKRSK